MPPTPTNYDRWLWLALGITTFFSIRYILRDVDTTAQKARNDALAAKRKRLSKPEDEIPLETLQTLMHHPTITIRNLARDIIEDRHHRFEVLLFLPEELDAYGNPLTDMHSYAPLIRDETEPPSRYDGSSRFQELFDDVGTGEEQRPFVVGMESLEEMLQMPREEQMQGAGSRVRTGQAGSGMFSGWREWEPQQGREDAADRSEHATDRRRREAVVIGDVDWS